MSKKCFLGFAIDILSCSILEIFKFLTLCTFDSKGFKSFPNEQILFSDEGEEIKTFSVWRYRLTKTKIKFTIWGTI